MFNTNNSISFIKFWSKNSFEHIDVLLNAYKSTKASMHFEKELKRLFKEFKDVHSNIGKQTFPMGNNIYIDKFLKSNNKLIVILERLKFEGFNGYPVLYEIAYHFLYEAKYINNVLNNHIYSQDYPHSVIMTIKYAKSPHMGLNWLYNQLYFWSLISAEHPSLLINITKKESTTIDKNVKERFINCTNGFNNINYMLSSIHKNMNETNLLPIKKEFMSLNNEFIKLLKDFKENLDKYLPEDVIKSLPDLFYGTYQHILDEQKYAKDLLE